MSGWRMGGGKGASRQIGTNEAECVVVFLDTVTLLGRGGWGGVGRCLCVFVPDYSIWESIWECEVR